MLLRLEQNLSSSTLVISTNFHKGWGISHVDQNA